MKYFYFIGTLLLALYFMGAGCKPPEIEGTIVHMQAKRMQEAYELALVAVEKYPQNPEAWFLLGKLQGDRDEIKEMVESYEKSLAIGPQFESDIKSEKNYYFGKFFNTGVSEYNKFLKLPDDQIESEEAMQYLQNSIDNFVKARYIENRYAANRLIAMSYLYKSDSTQALENLMQALEVNPDTVQAYIDLGNYYRDSGDYQKAMEYLKKGTEIDPNNTYCVTVYATICDMAGEREEAIDAYQKAYELNSEDMAIPFNLGLLYYRMANQIEEETPQKNALMTNAADWLLKAYELNPEIEDLYNLLGPVLINLDRNDEAINLLKEATDYFPESCLIWTNLSVAYARAGQTKEAEDTYKKVKEMGCD
jgi:tetratricopeptide (TPR) repeat protein